jgi:type II secretory pathway component PulF
MDANSLLRPRMTRLADLLEQGRDAREAARTARLGEVTGIALAAGHRTGNMEAALRYAEEYHQALVARLWMALTGLMWPVCTLILATIVGFVVLGLFLPLVHLINANSGGA